MKSIFFLGLFAWLAGSLFSAENTSRSLVAPVSPVVPGEIVKIGVLIFNPSTLPVAVESEPAIRARLVGKSAAWDVELTATPTKLQEVPPESFAVRTYTFRLPDADPGAYTLELLEARGASSVKLSVVSALSQATPEPVSSAAPKRAQPAVAFLDRSFAERITPHEAVYFIYGPDEPAAKFQISFKYKLIDFGGDQTERIPPSLQFGYTQRSLWDIGATSSPFYDTSYMPELIFESLAPAPNGKSTFTWLGYQAGYKHESNGRDGEISRSLNTVYARSAFAVTGPHDWKLVVAPELFTYVGGLGDNPRLKNYRGYGRLNVGISSPHGLALQAVFWAGKDFDHESRQFDLTIPLRNRWVNFEAYWLIQYFHGYGESLLDYEKKSKTIRAGISFVR